MGGDGRPNAAAFELKPGEEYLSVNWLEHFDAPHLGAAVERVRETFVRKGYQLRRNGRFAVLRVGAVVAAVELATERPSRVEHVPLVDDASHAGLFGYTADDFTVAAVLRALVHPEHVHAAVPGTRGHGGSVRASAPPRTDPRT